MSWISKLLPSISSSTKKKEIPEGVWSKCDYCKSVLYRKDLKRNLNVCPKCDYHMYIPARMRLENFLDNCGRKEIAGDIVGYDYLKFRALKRYKDQLISAQENTNEREGLVVIRGSVMDIPVVASAFEYKFIGGSMGAAVGERFVQGVESAIENKIPFVCFTASGGARMQESLVSLFQMAKTSAILARFSELGLPYIVVQCNPTMGGVSASLGTLGDIIIAEPGALIGFSGPRVIEQTIKQVLPEGFQRSEFLLEHGAIDMIVDRRELRLSIAKILAKLMHMEIVEDVS